MRYQIRFPTIAPAALYQRASGGTSMAAARTIKPVITTSPKRSVNSLVSILEVLDLNLLNPNGGNVPMNKLHCSREGLRDCHLLLFNTEGETFNLELAGHRHEMDRDTHNLPYSFGFLGGLRPSFVCFTLPHCKHPS